MPVGLHASKLANTAVCANRDANWHWTLLRRVRTSPEQKGRGTCTRDFKTVVMLRASSDCHRGLCESIGMRL